MEFKKVFFSFCYFQSLEIIIELVSLVRDGKYIIVQ